MDRETNLETPFKVGARLTLTIRDVAFGGEGVGRVDDFVVFVPFVIVGETVEVEVTELKRRFARARLVQVIEPSPERVTPGCRYFGTCGGCQYQHVGYAAQIRLKQKQVADLFQRVGGIGTDRIAPVIPCPRPYGYRNRLMIRSQWNKVKQGLEIGFIRHDNRLVVDIEECPIGAPELNEQIRQVRAHPPPKGGLKVVVRLLPDDWEVPRDSFFQTNFPLLPKLIETVRDRITSSGARFLIDVYCGVGFFALASADLVERFVGIEVDKMAIRAARHNAAHKGRTNGEFILGAAEEALPSLAGQLPPRQTSVILDPPRKGCHPDSLRLLREVRPAQIIYVSCQPATLARDLKLLTEDGVFEVVQVIPLDMFPQTQHIECVADLRRRGG